MDKKDEERAQELTVIGKARQRQETRDSIAKKGRFAVAKKAKPKAKKAKAKPKPKVEKPADDKLVVIARNPAEMQVAQQQLCSWAANQVDKSLAELREAEDGVAQAKKSKWRTTGFVTNLRYARERFNYYTKVKAALDAGYVIVPNFDLDIFAIRTTKFRPKNEETSGRWGKPHPSEFENHSDRPQLGDGEYVDPWPQLTHTVETVGEGDKARKENRAIAGDWRDVDFPYKLAKPQVLDSTSKAMARMIFDKIGVTPHRRARNQDPMIVGQITCKGRPSQEKDISFLITWWVDHTDLEV
jgi:hypothetical protein